MLKVSANIKLNLYLNITGRKENGYHLIDSLFVFLNKGDEIEIKESNKYELIYKGVFKNELPNVNENLITKTYKTFIENIECKNKKVKIILEKNIPIASAMGGGAIDAAAVFRGLNKFYDYPYSENKLLELGVTLGADIPSCIKNKPAFVSGIGENIEQIENLPKLYFVLINPMIPILTKEAYKIYKEKNLPFSKINENREIKNIKNIADIIKENGNDFLEIAKEKAPEINDILSILNKDKNCLASSITGKGPTCFGLYETKEDAEIFANKFKKSGPNWWIETAETIN